MRFDHERAKDRYIDEILDERGRGDGSIETYVTALTLAIEEVGHLADAEYPLPALRTDTSITDRTIPT